MSDGVLDLDELEGMARSFVRQAKPGSVVWLSGDLGTGKTAFVRAAVSAAGAHNVSSPTYALVHEYETDLGTIYHVDCYRLEDPAEATDIDFPELERTGVILFIEWPERAGDRAPSPDAHFRFSHVGHADRRLVESVV